MKHINKKENADVLAYNIRKKMEELRQSLMLLSYSSMYKYQYDINWYVKQLAFTQSLVHQFNSTYHKIQKEIGEEIKANKEILKPKQINALTKFIDVGSKNLIVSVLKERNDNLIQVKMKSNKAEEIYTQINQVMQSRPNGNYMGVTYRDGRTYKFESYMEMRARTEIQTEIASNMLEDGYNTGAIFYLCSYHGTCAEDHCDYQGRIYYDERYKDICPANVVEQVEAYIDANKLLTVQEVMNDEPYLTTRPNCRHYFTYISINEVLDIKNPKDVVDTLKERNMFYEGGYRSAKYDDLQKQRYNERGIVKWKEQKEIAQIQYKNMPSNISIEEKKRIKDQLAYTTHKVSEWQKKQRDLVGDSKHDNIYLNRQYTREKIGGKLLNK